MQSSFRRLLFNQFRLLEKTPDSCDGELHFQFTHAVLGQTPQYTAVSYTWGVEEPSERIHVDGQLFMIRPNLFACLRQLQHEWPLLWVDAVCINQTDVAERNEQVRLMGAIFANATIVSAWLGLLPLPERLDIEGPIVTMEADDFGMTDSIEWIASRPYWSRTWVIQEFLLARDVHIYCSNIRLQSQSFQESLARAAGVELHTVGMDDVVQDPELMHRWPALPLTIGRHTDRFPAMRQPLYDLLAVYAYAESTDPRDRVFALLGLLPLEERTLLERSFPDYSLSEQLVKIVTLAHLKAFAGDRPFEPILRALRISKASEVRRLLQMVKSLDYMTADNPAAEAEMQLTAATWNMDPEMESESPTDGQTCHNMFPANATINESIYQQRSRWTSYSSRVGKRIGFVVAIMLCYWAVMYIHRYRHQ